MAELWDVYDSERHLTGRIKQRGESFGADEFPLVVYIWIKSLEGKWLLTRRSPEKSEPLKWEPPGGHVLSGETSLQGALREAKEETGISLNPDEGSLFASFRRREPCWENPGFMDVWVFEGDYESVKIQLQPGETCAFMWATEAEIIGMITSGTFVPTQEFPYYRDLFGMAKSTDN